MKPILPSTVSAENRWYNEHLVYTHVPNGFLTLEATDGQIVDSSEFFKQREIYYGSVGNESKKFGSKVQLSGGEISIPPNPE